MIWEHLRQRAESLVRESGGLFVKALPKLEKLRRALERIQREIQNRYTIGFIPTSVKQIRDSRKVKLKLKRKGLKVRHRRGYYQ